MASTNWKLKDSASNTSTIVENVLVGPTLTAEPSSEERKISKLKVTETPKGRFIILVN